MQFDRTLEALSGLTQTAVDGVQVDAERRSDLGCCQPFDVGEIKDHALWLVEKGIDEALGFASGDDLLEVGSGHADHEPALALLRALDAAMVVAGDLTTDRK